MSQMAGTAQECRIEFLSTMRYAQAHKLALALYAYLYIRPTPHGTTEFSANFAYVDWGFDLTVPADFDVGSADHFL